MPTHRRLAPSAFERLRGGGSALVARGLLGRAVPAAGVLEDLPHRLGKALPVGVIVEGSHFDVDVPALCTVPVVPAGRGAQTRPRDPRGATLARPCVYRRDVLQSPCSRDWSVIRRGVTRVSLVLFAVLLVLVRTFAYLWRERARRATVVHAIDHLPVGSEFTERRPDGTEWTVHIGGPVSVVVVGQ